VSGDHVDLARSMFMVRSAAKSGKREHGSTAPPSGAKKPQSLAGGVTMQKQYMAVLGAEGPKYATCAIPMNGRSASKGLKILGDIAGTVSQKAC